MKWYEGPPLLYHLEHVHVASDRNLVDSRFPVQWVIRPNGDDDAAATPVRSPPACCAPATRCW